MKTELVHRQYTLVLKARSRKSEDGSRFIQQLFEGILFTVIDAFNSRFVKPRVEIIEVKSLEKEKTKNKL